MTLPRHSDSTKILIYKEASGVMTRSRVRYVLLDLSRDVAVGPAFLIQTIHSRVYSYIQRQKKVQPYIHRP